MILAASVTFALGSFVMGFASGKESLLAGRIIVGIGIGKSLASKSVYLRTCSRATTTTKASGTWSLLSLEVGKVFEKRRPFTCSSSRHGNRIALVRQAAHR